jgi:HPt (histidine-containing phosphotransfer) domain-containing protein
VIEQVVASGSEAGVAVFDRAALVSRVMNDLELAQVVIDGFLGDLPDQIERLKHGVAEGDVKQIEQHAHRIKGASATVGGVALSLVAAAMEQAAKAGDLEVARPRLAELETQFELLKQAMKIKV